MVAFSSIVDNILMAYSIACDSSNQSKWKELWKDLFNLQVIHHLPWNFLGDFDDIMGAHEHKGSHYPTRGPMFNFQIWSETNNLIHIPTKGGKSTWSNKRSNPHFIERRLDRCTCNQFWLDSYSFIRASTLTKLKS